MTPILNRPVWNEKPTDNPAIIKVVV